MGMVGAAVWLLQVVLEKLVADGLDAWAARVAAGADLAGDLRRLRSHLHKLHLLLSTAQEPTHKTRNEFLLRSLRHLHGLARDADNLLDEMLYRQIHDQLHADHVGATAAASSAAQFVVSKLHKRKVTGDDGGGGAKRMRLDGDDATRRIKEILERLCHIGDDVREAIKMEKLDAIVAGEARNAVSNPRGMTTAYFTEPKVFGRDAEKERIVELMMSGEDSGVNLSVLPIVGNGGVGKTTLALLVYNDERVQSYFGIRVWISVSVDFDEVRLTREMLDCMLNGGSKHDKITNLNELQEILEEHLKTKRLLLVLGDMWEDRDKSRWEKLLAPLRCSPLKGNMILVTMRNLSVVKMIGTMDLIHLDGLEEDDFWLLFKACAFGDEKYDAHQSLQIIGRQVAKKLKGYPLAAKSVGALLKRNHDGGHWMRILKSDEWKSQQGTDDIIAALKLSYIHLPFHLQRCFSYCALFPKDYRFDGEELVRIWISQSFVCSKNKRMEDTGHQYLNGLVD